MKRDPLMVAGAVGGMVVQQISHTLLAHINAPGLHRESTTTTTTNTKAELARDIGSMRHQTS